MRKAKKAIAVLTIFWLPVAAVLGFSACTGCMTNYAVGHHPEWRKLIAAPEDYGLQGETVHFASKDGLGLTGWWLEGNGSARGTVVLAHGMGGNRSHILRRAALCVRNGYNVLAIDLRGHGESEGNYMTPGYKEALDVLGAVDYVRQRGEAGRIVLFGYSYGAVAVLHAAARSSEPSAVIADAAFVLSDMLDRVIELMANDPKTPFWTKVGIGLMKWPGVRLLPRLEFYLRTGVDMNPKEAEATRAVERITDTPVLFLAGEHDPIAPPEIVQQLYEGTPTTEKAVVILSGATHRTLSDATQDQYEMAVIDFLNRYLHEDLRPYRRADE